MITRLIYSSAATQPMSKAKLYAILAKARVNNKVAGITGLLVFVDGVFLQVLEGASDSLGKLIDKIQTDNRHTDVTIISRVDVEKRLFPSWEMAYVSPSAQEVATWAGLRNTTTIGTTLDMLSQEPARVPEVLTRLLQAINEDKH
jgi:hypothetical protein